MFIANDILIYLPSPNYNVVEPQSSLIVLSLRKESAWYFQSCLFVSFEKAINLEHMLFFLTPTNSS